MRLHSVIKKYSTLFENVSALFILQIAGYILPLLTFPYLVRVLGTEKFGLFAFSQSFIQYFMTFTDYGFNLSATRQISIHRNNIDAVSEIASTTIGVKLALLIASYAVLFICIMFVPIFQTEKKIFWLTAMSLLGSVCFPLWLYQGMESMKFIAAFQLISRVLYVVAVFLFVKEESDYLWAAGLFSASWLLTGFLGLGGAIIFFRIKFAMPKWKTALLSLKEGRAVFFSVAGATLFNNTNTFFLGLFAPLEQVGFFSIADRITRAVIMLSTPIVQSIYPHSSRLFAMSDADAIGFLKRISIYGGASFSLLSLVLFVFASELAGLVSGAVSSETVMLIQIMAILPLSIFLDNILGTQILLNIGAEKDFMRVIWISGAVSIGLSLFLVPRFFALGTSAIYVFTELLLLFLMYQMVQKNLSLRRQRK